MTISLREIAPNPKDSFPTRADEKSKEPTEIWENGDGEDASEDFPEISGKCKDQVGNSEEDISEVSSIIHATYLFVLLWQGMYGISSVAIGLLFLFLKSLFAVCGHISGCHLLTKISASIPKSLDTIKSRLNLKIDDYTLYVVCRKCSSIYRSETCIRKLPNGKDVPITCCSSVKWPEHPHKSKRGPCNEFLMKKVRTKDGDYFWYSRKVFVHRRLIFKLRKLLTPSFLEKANSWKNRSFPDGVLSDINDGKAWKEFFWMTMHPLRMIIPHSDS